jgi:hypothetical protein
VLLADEAAAFEAAVRAELTPAGALEAGLMARIVTVAWRACRANRCSGAICPTAQWPTCASARPRSASD